jgi:hypothetical protein
MPDYRQILTEGLPPGNMERALMLTDAGVRGSGKRWWRRASYDETRAADVFGQTLANSAKRPFKANRNPYVQIRSIQYYRSPQLAIGVAGLGADDYDADMSETIYGYDSKFIATAPGLAPTPSGGSSSGWGDVLQSMSKTLTGGIASGLTNLIGGRPSTVIQTPPSTGPSITSLALIGGGIAAAAWLMFRRK